MEDETGDRQGRYHPKSQLRVHYHRWLGFVKPSDATQWGQEGSASSINHHLVNHVVVVVVVVVVVLTLTHRQKSSPWSQDRLQ